MKNERNNVLYLSVSPNNNTLRTIWFSEWLKLFIQQTQIQYGETDQRTSLIDVTTNIPNSSLPPGYFHQLDC